MSVTFLQSLLHAYNVLFSGFCHVLNKYLTFKKCELRQWNSVIDLYVGNNGNKTLQCIDC